MNDEPVGDRPAPNGAGRSASGPIRGADPVVGGDDQDDHIERAWSRLEPVLEESRLLGFLGPAAVRDPFDHAVAHCRAVISHATDTSRLCDLGTGGGVPGLVLAELLPRSEAVLVESMVRRAAFLREAVETLGLGGRVQVVEERAENVGRGRFRAQFRCVTARSFAPPAVTAEIAAPLLEIGGVLVVGGSPESSTQWSSEPMSMLGFEPARIVVVDGRHFVIAHKSSATAERWPRRVGMPTKRPLW